MPTKREETTISPKVNTSECSRRAIGVALMLGTILGLSETAAAAYPDRPIRLVVPFASGSNIDLTARQIAPKFAELLGQQVIVDNRGGAGGTIGATIVAKATPDGYTILMGNAPTHGMAPNLYKKLAYDPIKDFAPIGRMDTATFALAVSAMLPVKSVRELVAYARARPGQLNYASSGNGTTAHLSGVLFANKTGVDIKHIPYNSVSMALVDLASGAVAMMFYPPQALAPVTQNGKARFIATTGIKRSSYLPELPTVMEAGVPDFVAMAWHGYYAPAGTPKHIIDVLYAALVKAMQDPQVVANLTASDIDIALLPPNEFATFTKAELERYRQLIAIAGVKIQ